MATTSEETVSPNPATSGGMRALYLAGIGCLMGLLIFLGITFNCIDVGGATLLFFGTPFVELAALIMGVWLGRRTWQGRVAIGIAVACLVIWGWAFYMFLTAPLIRLF